MDEALSLHVPPFFEQPQVILRRIPVGKGVPLGIKRVYNTQLGIGGVYGSWGTSYDNNSLLAAIESYLGEPILPEERIDLPSLGFLYRHHTVDLTPEEHLDVEIQVGAHFLREAAQACGWEPEEVQAVLIGNSAPIVQDYTERIACKAGIPETALKVSVHKACDSSVGALHLALNPELGFAGVSYRNLAQDLYGKKVLVGGIEGVSRLVSAARDKIAMQFFGNGAGVIGVIPGETMKFLAGKSHEVFDEKGVMALHMYYPHSGRKAGDQSNVEISEIGQNRILVAGLMHEPADEKPIDMAGMMGMVKLFVRTCVQVMQEVYGRYVELMERRGTSEKSIRVVIIHHANMKIKNLIEKFLQNEGIHLYIPWLLSEFGNVSAASNMMAFLRQLPHLNPGDHVLIDGFGAGTYYDAMIVALGEL